MKNFDDKEIMQVIIGWLLGSLSVVMSTICLVMFDPSNEHYDFYKLMCVIHIGLYFICDIFQHYEGGAYNVVLLIFRLISLLFAILFAWLCPIYDSKIYDSIMSSPITHIILISPYIYLVTSRLNIDIHKIKKSKIKVTNKHIQCNRNNTMDDDDKITKRIRELVMINKRIGNDKVVINAETMSKKIFITDEYSIYRKDTDINELIDMDVNDKLRFLGIKE